jgi:hypothetical protein
MAKRLLDRQASLLEYLASGRAIFGDDRGASLHPSLQGIDRRLLYLEARFSHEKRMEKIAAVLPRTFKLLGNRRAAIERRFAENCPPTEIGLLANACQFFDFLSAPQLRGLRLGLLRDVAGCELACAKVRAAADRQEQRPRRNGRSRGLIRRSPRIVLQRCNYDIRPLFEREATGITPCKRTTRLAIAMPRGAAGSKIFELLPAAFNLLAALDDWTDASAFADAPETRALLAELRKHRLLEVGR